MYQSNADNSLTSAGQHSKTVISTRARSVNGQDPSLLLSLSPLPLFCEKVEGQRQHATLIRPGATAAATAAAIGARVK